MSAERWRGSRLFRWLPTAVLAAAITAGLFASNGRSVANESVVAVASTGPTATTTQATTRPTPAARTDDDQAGLPSCPSPSAWEPSIDGQGVIATLYETGPAYVSVTVVTTSTSQTRSASVPGGQSSVAVDFRGIPAPAVSSVTVTANGPGPLPTSCLLARG